MIYKSEIKHLYSLKQKKYRKKTGEFLIEGTRIITSALESVSFLKTIFITEHFKNSNSSKHVLDKIKKGDIPLKIIDEQTMKIFTDTENPSGISALCPLPELKLNINDFIGPGLFLDAISDPGNLGTICRTTAWFGVQNVILSPNCVDPFNPKVVRAGMGAHFHLNFYNISLKDLSENNYEIIGAGASGIPIHEFKQQNKKNWILVLGNEAHGISKENQALLNETISIPKYGAGESLNVAISAGILLSFFVYSSTK